jgi:exodeoxyribonuclease VII large subunit
VNPGDVTPLPPAGAEPLPPGTIRVSALAERIHLALREAFPRRFWIVGETSELERATHRAHWFFRICENQARDGKRYALGAVIWQADHRRMFGPHGSLKGALEPKDGVEIRALVDVDFYGPSGDLRLVVRDIDPTYTLGKMALERQRLIARLTAEGVLARQKQLTAPELPLAIGLITADNSAAYNDFVVELQRGGFAFRVWFRPAKMQGEETARTVRSALRALARRPLDAIAIVRGGGSTVDLAWFDREEVVRAIAECPVPVFTGIGHEIDSTVADLAAHRSFKTPTALAAHFVELASGAWQGVREARTRLALAAELLRDEREALLAAARRLGQGVAAIVREERVGLAAAKRALVRLPRRIVETEHRAALSARRRFALATQTALAAPERAVALRRQRLLSTPLLPRLSVELAALARIHVASRRAAHALLERHEAQLVTARARTRLLDPQSVLARGFALLRDLRGRVLPDAARLEPGLRFVAQLRDGHVHARVEPQTLRDDRPGAKNGQEANDPGSGRPRQLDFLGGP